MVAAVHPRRGGDRALPWPPWNGEEDVRRALGGGHRTWRNTAVPPRCEFGHLHSIVTRTPRVLRDAFRIWGEPLVDIDVSNCQPLLLGLLARAAWWRRIRAAEKTRETTERRREEREEEAEPTGRVLSSILRTDLDECVQTPDLIGYIDICRFGGFYQAMSGILEMPCSSPSELARVKVESMRLIFGRHRPSLRSWMRFSDRWPTVASHLAGG